MDIPKTSLAKSKSSNSTSEAKKNTKKNEKVSRSSAEFQPRTALSMGVQPLMLKKRGVYVEKKSTKLSINQSKQIPDVPSNELLINLRPMPRPNKKRFLTSVLTILSKSTAGTQCPPPDDVEGTRKTDKTMNKQKIMEDEEDIREEWTTAPNNSKKKPKYRSKILNNQACRDSFTVLQSKKEIVPSSSNSEYINAKYDASSVNPETIRWTESLPPPNQEYDGTASAASHSKKVRLITKDSKPSMVSDNPKSFDNGIYDFFVDMIQTTMNVEGLDTEPLDQQVLTSANLSKVTLQSTESLTRKIDVQKIEESESETKVSRKQSSHHAYSIMPDETDEITNKQMLGHFQPQINNYRQSRSPTTKRKPKLKTDSFQYKKVTPLPKITSQPLPNKKKWSKITAKKDFLKLLKEELQMKSNETFEEPQNLFDALKVIAKNKRRSQEWKLEVPSEPDDHICDFKPHRVLSKKSTVKQSGYYSEPRPVRKIGMTSNKKRKVIKQYDDESDYSHHSLEVTGYDYIKPKKKAKKNSGSVVSTPPLPPPKRYEYGIVNKKPKPAKTVKKSNVAFKTTPPTPPYYDDFWTDYCDNDVSPLLLQRQYVLDKLKQLES